MIPRAGLAWFRLMLARACAWALLVAGWIGIGSVALSVTPSVSVGCGLVALWLFALGAVAAVATRGSMRHWTRGVSICVGAIVTAAGLWWTVHGGGVDALVVALLGWAALTALASGVVRSLRIAQTAVPEPPVIPASLGALAAGLALGDIGELPSLVMRLTLFVGFAACVLLLLQSRIDGGGRAPGCRAGLFDCSLPAWPAGAWGDAMHWPTLLSGLAMLPMMATLPLMAAWCRAESVEPQTMVLLHLAAMFGPALIFRHSIPRWSPRVLSTVCALLLAFGAGLGALAEAPVNLIGVAVTHGAAWGIAWSGQLWAPERRGRQGASPLQAAAGYALLTVLFGLIVERTGTRGVVTVHAFLGLAALLAWMFALGTGLRSRSLAARERVATALPRRE